MLKYYQKQMLLQTDYPADTKKIDDSFEKKYIYKCL